MRYAARRDASEPHIIAALEKAGCSVIQMTQVDLLVGRLGRTFALECKTPGKSGESRIRPIQKKLRSEWWQGHYKIVTTPEEALKAVGL